MSALQLNHASFNLEEIKLEETPKPVPTPGNGEVVVRVTLRPVNPADIFTLMGAYPGAPYKPGNVPGLEGVGVVESAGPGVALKVGQRVVVTPDEALKGNGTWQSHVLCKEIDVIPVPDSVSDETAAQAVVNPVTVYGMLKDIQATGAPKGAFILQQAAGSVLGRQFIQMAKHFGFRTINVVRRKELVEELTLLGADYVIDASSEDFVARTKEITNGEGAYCAIDPIAGEMTGQVAAAVRTNGFVLGFGAMDGKFTITASVGDILFREVSIKGWWLKLYLERKTVQERAEVYNEVMGMLADGTIAPYSGTKYPLGEWKAALAEATKPGRGGKVFLSSSA